MPCYDSRNEPCNVRAEAKKEFQADLDKLTRMLCATCRVIELEHREIPKWLFDSYVEGGEVVQWWKEHKKLDEARETKKKK